MTWMTCTPTCDWRYYCTPYFWIIAGPALIWALGVGLRALQIERRGIRERQRIHEMLRRRMAR